MALGMPILNTMLTQMKFVIQSPIIVARCSASAYSVKLSNATTINLVWPLHTGIGTITSIPIV